MSRPVIFNQPFVYNWSTEANFPSGAYVGTPTKVTPPGDIFFPDQPLPAQSINYVLSQFGPVDTANQNWSIANLTGILNWTGNDIALQWYPTQLPSTIATGLVAGDTNNHGLLAISWDPFDQAWQGLFSVTDGSAASRLRVASTTGTDTTWQASPFVNVAANPNPLLVGSSDMVHDNYFENITYFAIPLGAGNGFAVYTLDTNAGTCTNVLTVAGFTAQNITMTFFGLSGYVIVGVTDAAGTNTALYSSDDFGATWGHTTYATQTGKWYFQTVTFAGTLQIAAIAAGLGGQTALLHTSNTGAAGSWSVGSPVGLAGENVHGLARINQPISSSTFVNSLAVSVGKTVQITGDGVIWTTEHTSAQFDVIDDMKGVGTLLVANVDTTKLGYTFSRGGSDDMALIFSTDNGQDWSWSPAVLRPPSGSTLRRLADNSTLNQQGVSIVPTTQLAMFHAGAVRFSMAQGSSMLAGF